jgi:hypothetical protein
MIKALNKTDVLVTPFDAQKNWEVDNLNPSDLIQWMSQSIDPLTGITSSLSGSVSLTYIDYGDNSAQYPITNSYCNISLQQQSKGYVTFQKGVANNNLYPSASFYTSDVAQYDAAVNPKNLDGTYMRLIYSQNQHLFYNQYNNFTKTFGMESADLTDTNRTITDTMDVFTIPQNKFGEKILPKSVKIIDDSLDKQYTIIDDGNCNLIFSGSVFSIYERDSLLNSLQQNLSANAYSYDVTGSVDNRFSSLLFNTAGDISVVSSSVISVVPVGGIAPYSIQWYIGGEFRDLWTLSATNEPNITVRYNTIVSPTNQLYYSDTYVVCQIIDLNNNQTYSNLIYLNSGSVSYSPTPVTGSPISTSSAFPPTAPTDAILHLINSGISYTPNQSGQNVDNRYLLYNYIPDERVSNGISGIPSDVSPYSSSFVNRASSLWFSSNSNVANWITPINPTKNGYGNIYAGTYCYRIYFDLITPNEIALDPNGFTLNGYIGADNSASILLNGNPTGNEFTNTGYFLDKTQFNITGGFVYGRNYLDFIIYNYFSGDSLYGVFTNPTGLYVEFDPSNPLFYTETPPSVIQQSNNSTINLGSPLSLSATVTGSLPISYQWYFNGSAIPYAISHTFNKLYSQTFDSGSYVLSASNSFGATSTTPIQLTIVGPQAQPPVILTQPTYTVNGHILNVTVNATGNGTLHYAWYRDGINIGNDSNLLQLDVNNYAVGGFILSDYYVVVSNSDGSVTSNTLHINYAFCGGTVELITTIIGGYATITVDNTTYKYGTWFVDQVSSTSVSRGGAYVINGPLPLTIGGGSGDPAMVSKFYRANC